MIRADLIDHCGSDLSVVNAARVSFAKEVSEVGLKDAGLIRYLAKHKHKSPFNHCFASFRVAAPIFVARQLVKHEYLPWNEVSRRYVDDTPVIYKPVLRKRADSVKQGSSDEVVQSTRLNAQYVSVCEAAVRAYEAMLEEGVAPEVARSILPQSMMTEWIWSGTLGAFAKMAALRLDPHAQAEARAVAEAISTHMEKLFPYSWEALREYPIL